MVKRGEPLEEFYSLARQTGVKFRSRQVRDLTVVELGNGFSLVVAVDSDGGIGPRENDVVKVSDYVLGRFAMRVPLMEVLCCGALPVAAFDMLTVSRENGGEIVRGIRDELAEAGLPEDFPLSGSTEDNVPTTMTGVGTTVLGIVREDDSRPGGSKANDVVVCAGIPKSGPDDEIRLDDDEIVRQSQVSALLGLEVVHDVLPVGSRGVLYEAEEMARSAGLRFVESGDVAIDLTKSAGPSTCVLASAEAQAVETIAKMVAVPVATLGRLRED